ncbi:response regulator transcription factor [Serratia sp. L9]|uniref:response regulator transcription factor n=1 Tax=Serratia sp. L9 TaxID=3423946 RepID=UPI003D67C12B
MKLLIVDECSFTRLGIADHFTDNVFASVTCCQNIEAALPLLASLKPNHILINLTKYCRYSEDNSQLQSFIAATRTSMLHIYLDAPYPYCKSPMRIANNAFLFNKAALPEALKVLRESPVMIMNTRDEHSLFSPQELTVMKYWMSEMPNYRIAKKLQISSHTVYVHKRHITEKINVRNRLEFYSLYNVLRYFYPPQAMTANTSSNLLVG